MLIAAYGLFVLAHLVIGVFAVRLFVAHRSSTTLMLMLPILALIYDNAIAATGAFVGEGSTLMALTYPRFVGHALLTPAWIVASTGLAAMAGVDAAQRRGVWSGSWLVYAAMVALGVLDALVLLDLAPLQEGDVLVYTNAGGLPGPPAPALVMVVITLVWGALVWRRIGWAWMFAGALFMFVAAAVPAHITGFVLSASGEVVMAASLVATGARVLPHDDRLPAG